MDINTFILKYVVKREQSLFAQEIDHSYMKR